MKHVARIVMIIFLLLDLPARLLAGPAAGLDIDSLPEYEVTASSLGGTLLLSDSPEMVKGDGVLYQDRVTGKVRLFYYHVNAGDTARKIDVILENDGPEAAGVTVRRYGLGGPGFVWMAVGKEALTSYLAGGRPYRVTVPAKGAAVLSPSVSEAAVLPNTLVNGIFDFDVDRPVTVKVLMMPLLTDSVRFAGTAGILPPDREHLRGTFAGADRLLLPRRAYNPASDGVLGLTLADNVIDRYLQGVDATDGSNVVNYGNYGVVYKILLASAAGSKAGYYLAPRGGPYAGAVGLSSSRHTLQEPVATPAGRTFFGLKGANDAAFLGAYDGGEMWLTFSPPGGSNLPVRIILLAP